MPTVSIGMCVHNEERSIRESLSSISSQSFNDFKFKEILVVSSGSIDLTDALVEDLVSNDSRVRLVVQEWREDNSSAVNLIMKEAKGDVLVLVNEDNQPTDMKVSILPAPLLNKKVGSGGGHPIPVNTDKTFVAFTVRML